jgi:CRISPR-associated protein Cas1
VDARKDALPGSGDAGDGRIHARSVTLASDALGLIATLDLLEGTGEAVTPVDYKRGAPRELEGALEAWPTDRAQLTAQALILREHGYTCDEAVVYYRETKQRVRIRIDEAVAAETRLAVEPARGVAEQGRIPPPLCDSPKCVRCSLAPICLPDETRAALRLPADADPQLPLFEAEPDDGCSVVSDSADVENVRRLVPARDDLRPLYVMGHGLTVGKSGDVLQVRDARAGRQPVQEARLNDVSQVNLFGSAQLTAAALQALCYEEKPIAHFSTGGWLYGFTQGLGLKNVFLRQAQFRVAGNPEMCLTVARALVAGKIRNQRTLLQRNHVEPPAASLERMKRLAAHATRAVSLEALLGIEGSAAREYFEQFAGMLKAERDDGTAAFDFASRNRRPPRDPVNALLSLGYALLTKDLTIVCASIGFDPFMGLYHQLRFGRPALSLDLMEPFRPLVVDSAVLSAINTGMVTRRDFVTVGNSVALEASGRRGLLRAYEQRMDTLVTHPQFGYRVSYRRVLEIQARLLARFIEGETRRYEAFETR